MLVFVNFAFTSIYLILNLYSLIFINGVFKAGSQNPWQFHSWFPQYSVSLLQCTAEQI